MDLPQLPLSLQISLVYLLSLRDLQSNESLHECIDAQRHHDPVSYTHLDVYKRQYFLLYLAGLVCLAISNLSLIQAIFDLMNRCIILCNVRFDLSLDRFAADARAAFGSIIYGD